MRVSCALLAVGCSQGPAQATHTLVFGGDVTLGRNINSALYDPDARARIFESIADPMRDADITLVNAEGVIAGGGRFYDKGESRPYTYRAHPVAMELLADVGIDVLAAGNNHTNDYGPWALREMIDRAGQHDIQITGAGLNTADARRPIYVELDDMVVAFVGADLTYGQKHEATDSLPGTFWLPGLDKRKRTEVVEGLEPPLREARAHADLVFLTPHWGANWEASPTDHIQALARDIIGLGYDGILGHSAHVLQGIGQVDGKPVIYDAGNLLSDYNPPKKHAASALFRLHLSPHGVTAIDAIPLSLQTNRVIRTEGASLQQQKTELIHQSAPLGVVMTAEAQSVRAHFTPSVPIMRSSKSPPPPPRTTPESLRIADSRLWVDTLPPTATPTSVVWPGGLELIGYELLLNELRIPKSGQVTTLYWQTSEPQPASRIFRAGAIRDQGRIKPMDHIPGDWMIQADRWPTGAILRDQTLVRLTGEAAGTVQFTTAVLSTIFGRPILPLSSELSTTESGEVILGSATYTEDSNGIWEHWPRP